jgi:hypothetical protein
MTDNFRHLTARVAREVMLVTYKTGNHTHENHGPDHDARTTRATHTKLTKMLHQLDNQRP